MAVVAADSTDGPHIRMSGSPRILLLRRDNIGDLVCTTPLIAALRAQLPAAWLGAVVTTYNAEVLRRTGAAAPIPVDTADLKTLIAALSVADRVICPDGGAMHLAAALGKPVVALFGDSPVERWRPWGVPHCIVRPESRILADLPLEPVLDAFHELQDRFLRQSSPVRP